MLSTKFENLTALIDIETKAISKFLDIIACSSTMKKRTAEISEIPAEMKEIKNETSRFATKILALAFKGQNLEDSMKEFCESSVRCNKKSEEMVNNLTSMATELSLTHDELQRVLILFQKYLNIEINEDGKIPQEKIENLQNALEKVKRITDEDFTPPTDDFFFIDGKENENVDETKNRENSAIDEIDSKLAKKYFKPVLVQLRERIEVIGEDFKERERKVLKSKGIEIDDHEQDSIVKPSYSDEDSGSDDERERQKRFKKNQEKFKENRAFLESKQQINIFASLPSRPLQNFDEDFIE